MHDQRQTPENEPLRDPTSGRLCLKIGKFFSLIIEGPHSTGLVLVIVFGAVLCLVLIVATELIPIKSWLRTLGIAP